MSRTGEAPKTVLQRLLDVVERMGNKAPHFKGPPAMVTFLPSFWLLVPGSLGLLSVTRMLSDRAAGLDGLTTALFAFASIALGTLLGASLYRWLTERIG